MENIFNDAGQFLSNANQENHNTQIVNMLINEEWDDDAINDAFPYNDNTISLSDAFKNEIEDFIDRTWNTEKPAITINQNWNDDAINDAFSYNEKPIRLADILKEKIEITLDDLFSIKYSTPAAFLITQQHTIRDDAHFTIGGNAVINASSICKITDCDFIGTPSPIYNENITLLPTNSTEMLISAIAGSHNAPAAGSASGYNSLHLMGTGLSLAIPL